MQKFWLSFLILAILPIHAEEEIKHKKDSFTFSVSGNSTFYLAPDNQSVNYYTGKDVPSNSKVKTDSSTALMAIRGEVVFSALGKLENGSKYGAKISLEANKGAIGIDKAYLFFEKDNVGTFHAGNIKGPDSTMVYGGQRLLGGALGLDGTILGNTSLATGVITPINMIGTSGKATKLIYYSPIMYGFQAGIGVAADTKHFGLAAKNWKTGDSSTGNDEGVYCQGIDEKEKPSGTANVSFGLTHEYKFNDNLSTKLSFVCLRENTRPININSYNINYNDIIIYLPALFPIPEEMKVYKKEQIKLNNAFSYYISGTITYKKFSLALGYLDNGKSRLPVDNTYINKKDVFIPGGFITGNGGNAGSVWNIGGKYAFNEKLTFSTVYHNMQRNITKSEKSTGHAFSFATDYVITSGLAVFGEVDFVSSEASDSACMSYNLTHSDKSAIKKQNAAVFTIGAKVTF